MDNNKEAQTFVTSTSRQETPLTNLTKNQKHLLTTLEQELLQRTDIGWTPEEISQQLDHLTLYRYLQATDWKVKNAKDMLLESLKWRREVKPHKISCKDVEHHFKHGKNYHNGTDKLGRPIIVMRVKRDTPEDNEGKLRLLLYQMERSLRLMKGGVYQSVWLVDCTGFGLQNMSPSATKLAYRLVQITTSHYPERLGLLLIVNPPILFTSFWALLKPFVAATTVSKFIFIPNKQRKQVLSEYIGLDSLESEFGGNNDYEYDHDSYVKTLLKEEREWLHNKSKKKRAKKDDQTMQQKCLDKNTNVDNDSLSNTHKKKKQANYSSQIKQPDSIDANNEKAEHLDATKSIGSLESDSSSLEAEELTDKHVN